MDLNHRTRSRADLQSAAFNHSAIDPKKHALEPRKGLEPPTGGLQNRCSTNWATLAVLLKSRRIYMLINRTQAYLGKYF